MNSNITEVILLDLTTTKKRREFFGFNNSVEGKELTKTFYDLYVKTERETLQDE
jgi:hypothetical protein